MLFRSENAKNIENDNNSYVMPILSLPAEASTFQNSKSQIAVETIIGVIETLIDEPNVHHIDNSTANINTSDSTIDKETNNQLEMQKILKTITIPMSCPKFPHQRKQQPSKIV